MSRETRRLDERLADAPQRSLLGRWRAPSALFSLALWLFTAALVTLLALRFGMRLLGVRYDTSIAGAVYALTEPLVEPFYRWFPAAERFDYRATEAASLVAAGTVVVGALTIYVVCLLVVTQLQGRRRI